MISADDASSRHLAFSEKVPIVSGVVYMQTQLWNTCFGHFLDDLEDDESDTRKDCKKDGEKKRWSKRLQKR